MRRQTKTRHGSPVMHRRVLRLVACCVALVHSPLCVRVFLRQPDTAGNNGTGQPLDNYLTVACPKE
jgi:hypothetical protein